MDCPKCGLVNPASALRCDCGYDFPSEKMQTPYLSASDPVQVRRRRMFLHVQSIAYGSLAIGSL
jgi:hypothetical protein